MKSYLPLILVCLVAPIISGGCQVELLHDLDEQQATRVLEALHRAGIAGTKERHDRGNRATYTIAAPSADAARALTLVQRQNLPRRPEAGLGEVFGKVGLVPTTAQERAMLRHAIAGELSQTLLTLDGVVDARVHVVLPNADPLAQPQQRSKPRASVLLKVDRKPPITTTAVRQLVSGSVADLAPDQVNVVIARVAPAQGTPGAAPLARVGPFAVSAASRGPLLATLSLVVLLLGGLAMAFWLTLRRMSHLRRAYLAREAATSADRDLDASMSLIADSVHAHRPATKSRATGARRDT